LFYNTLMKTLINKNDIVKAALLVIEKEGFHTFTIKKVADYMGTDMQGILTQFTDANSLIDAAMKQSLIEGLEKNLEECIFKDNDSLSFLTQLFNLTLSGALQNPKIVKFHFYYSFIQESVKCESAKDILIFIEKVWSVFEPTINNSQKEQVKRRLYQAFSSILFIGIFPTIFCPISINRWADDLAHSVIGK